MKTPLTVTQIKSTFDFGPAWAESNSKVARGLSTELTIQQAVLRRASAIRFFLAEGYTRAEAEEMAGPSCFGPRARQMVEEALAQ